VRLDRFDRIGGEKHPGRACHHLRDALRRWRGRGLENERQEQRGLTGHHELRGCQRTIVDLGLAGFHAGLEIGGEPVDIVLQQSADLQSTLATHSYDALLYGISIGADPDVYAYWDSAQADMRAQNRLNFSEYSSSKISDVALEAGRTRLDPALRIVKYRPFLQAWQADAPALGLYQPSYLYITRGPVYGLEEHYINNATDRYSNVQNWMVRQVLTSQADIK